MTSPYICVFCCFVVDKTSMCVMGGVTFSLIAFALVIMIFFVMFWYGFIGPFWFAMLCIFSSLFYLSLLYLSRNPGTLGVEEYRSNKGIDY